MSILSNKRKHLSAHEMEVLLKTCRDHRNHTMILLAFRHGMRVSELIGLEWNAIDLTTGTISLHRRHAQHSALSWTPQHPIDSHLHPLECQPLQWMVQGLTHVTLIDSDIQFL